MQVAVDHIIWLGHPVVKLRTDGEPSVKSFADAVAAALKERGLRAVPDLTPKGDSQAGGVQESAVQQFKGKCRVICSQTSELHGLELDAKHPLLPWAVAYAGQLVTRTVVTADGLTSYRKITGRREVPRPLQPWGEKVLFLPGGGKPNHEWCRSL